MPATNRQALTEAGPAHSKALRHQAFKPGVHVIFVATSHFGDIGEERHGARIPCDPAAHPFETGDVLGSLTPDRLQQLEDHLGPGLVSNIGPKEKELHGSCELASRIAKRQKNNSTRIQPEWNERLALLHQDVVTMLWAERSQRMTIEYRTLDWAIGLIRKGANGLVDHVSGYSQPVAFYIPLQAKDWTLHPDVRRLYEAIDGLRALRGDISVIPSYQESWNYGYGVADVQALDSIASDNSTPEPYRWRPITCLGFGVCPLAELQGPQYTKFGFGERPDYIHQNPQPAASTHVHSLAEVKEPGSLRVIHQQYPSSFSKWGHIRVFMVGNQIVTRGFFSRNQETKVYHMSPLHHECHFDFRAAGLRHPNLNQKVKEQQKAKLEELDNFCRWWHQQLMKRYPELFKSLNVGCVMVIGLSEASLEGKFFVFGVFRWYVARFFSMDLAVKPYDQICRAFGEQFARVHGSFAADDSRN
ncbi:hypothetical protein FBEOM_13072 [Fusarium beomiforme]|uniref:Uncharacterized protein n=1 Tax=Fusarium beomiforme TaxID=44412 RepID=A0A9P5A7H3_9HYPO|nr:hypothetical protein FBEOM_13072 [Fusarium beomiforme]